MGYLGLRIRLLPDNYHALQMACLYSDVVYDWTLSGLPSGEFDEFDEQFLRDVWEDLAFEGKDVISLSVVEGTLRQLYEDLRAKGNAGVHPRNGVEGAGSFIASIGGKDVISQSVLGGTLRQLYGDARSDDIDGIGVKVDSFATSVLKDDVIFYPNLVLIPGVGPIKGNTQDVSRAMYSQTMGWKFDYCVVSLEDGQWTAMLLAEGEQKLLDNTEYVQKLGDRIGELI